MDIHELTIKKFHNGLVQKKFSVSEVVQEMLDCVRSKNEVLHVFHSVFKDVAIERAHQLDNALDTSSVHPLYGVPFAIKDNILMQGKGMSASSKILGTYTSAYDATVIRKLSERSAVFMGKTNLDEFAMGSSTENSAYGPTKNPLDETKVPGGSSGGSAAAVCADMALGALGSDTGGSIRQPASFCGVVGMKPTYGAVSRHGITSLASSLDQVGPFAKTVEDAEYIFDAITGKDTFDATTSDAARSFVSSFDAEHVSNMTIGVPKEYFVDGIDPDVSKEVMGALDVFKKHGFSIREISLPHTAYALACYYIIMPAEASSNLARYDGIRYGTRASVDRLADLYKEDRKLGFGSETIRRVLLGTFVLSSGYYDAYYAKAQKVRRKILEDFQKAFEEVDVIFTPATPSKAFGIGEKSDNPMDMYLSDIFTITANLAGVPAISIPVRDRKEYTKEHMPVNFQLIGKHFHDKDLFLVGKQYESIVKKS